MTTEKTEGLNEIATSEVDAVSGGGVCEVASTMGGTLIGGLLGSAGGPAGTLAGAVIGAGIGQLAEDTFCK